MKVSKGELVLTGAELAAAPARLGLLVGPLSRIPQVANTEGDAAAVASFFAEAREPVAALWRGAIATLARPGRIGVLHYALGEESLARAILAWGPDTLEEAVLMVSRAEDWVIRRTTAEELAATIRSVLLEGTAPSPSPLRVVLSQDAALIFLAVLHALRAARLKSLLDHAVAPIAFTVAAIAEVLEDSGVDDFRWPLLFWDKVLPFSLDGISWDGRIAPALTELRTRGLIEEVKGAADTWMLTPLGYPLAVADAQHLTKVGLRVTKTRDEDLKAHETFLFQRSLQDVLLIDLGGREAVIASLGFGDLGKLLTGVLTPPADAIAPKEQVPPPLPTPTSPEAAAPARSAPRFCASCGAKLVPGAKFCRECGASTSR